MDGRKDRPVRVPYTEVAISTTFEENEAVLRFDPAELDRRAARAKNRVDRRPRDPISWLDKYRPVFLSLERPEMKTRPPHLIKWIKHLLKYKKVIICGPPGHGKSWAVQDALIMKIAKDRNIRALWISKTEQEAMKAVGAIRDDLEENKELIRDYGVFKRTGRWGKKEFTVRRSIRGALDKEPTIKARGITGQIEGSRVNHVVLDDPIDIGSMFYESDRIKAREWYKSTLQARMDPGATIWIIGSRWQYSDLYGYLKTQKRQFPPENIIETPAILDWENKKVLAPEMCDWDYLMDQREGAEPDMFDLRYQQMAASRENAPFPEISPISLGEIMLKAPRGGSPFWFRFVGADWNASESKKSHLSALVFLDLLVDGTMVLSACFDSQRKRGYREWVRACIREASMTGTTLAGWPAPYLIASESIGFQDAISQELENFDYAKGLLGVPIKRVGSSRKRDDPVHKYQRILRMAPWIETDKLRIYDKGKGMDRLHADLIGYPDINFDDRLDAAERAVNEAILIIRRNAPGGNRIPVMR